MSISMYKIKKWFKMLNGTSISHVNQSIGKCYSKKNIKGYYNDFTEKVLKRNIKCSEVPTSYNDKGEIMYFSIEIFQYGLGSYDLFLLTHDKNYLDRAITSAKWAVSHQEENGGWATFIYKNKDRPYSSMAQGEGISLLLRVYNETKDNAYLIAADRAFNFLINQKINDGISELTPKGYIFYETPIEPLILNGWIFTIWGIYDYWLFYKNKKYKDIYELSIKALESYVNEFDLGFWSRYDINKRICSPFYHKLHIEQLKIMYDLTNLQIFKNYYIKWEKNQNNWFYRTKAFFIKSFQKVFE